MSNPNGRPIIPRHKAPKLAWREYVRHELRRSYRRGLIELDAGLLSYAGVTGCDESRRTRALAQPRPVEPPVQGWRLDEY